MDFTITNDSAIRTLPKKSKKVKEYYDLKVYKAVIDLLKQLTNSTQKSPNYVKFGILLTMLLQLITIAYNICDAANRKDRKDFILQAYKKAKRILVSIRVLLDINAITKKGFSAVSSKSEDVVRLLNGWYYSELKKEAEF